MTKNSLKELIVFINALSAIGLAVFLLFIILEGIVYGFEKFSFYRFMIVLSIPLFSFLLTSYILKKFSKNK